MAQKTTVVLTDDLTGEEANDISTVEFGLDGRSFEIDLTGKNADALRDALADYVAAARRTSGRTTRRSAPRSNGSARSTSRYDRATTKHIREWGKAQGWELSERGRVPNDVVTAWEAEHARQAA